MLLANIRDQITASFNLSELQDMCLDLSINFENLAGSTLNDKSREIVAFCNRRGRLQELVDRSIELRPNLEWNEFYHDIPLNDREEHNTPQSFSHPIRTQMTELNKTVETLTQDQYEIIKWLRGRRRVAIAGCAGSGKTLIAAEKAIRLDAAGVRTLILCHNPNLAEHLKRLTTGTGVVVFDFLSWIYSILKNQHSKGSFWITYSNYQEPLPDEIKKACNLLINNKLKHEAIVIDEAQDFREEWWAVIESALVANGILYAFHDDNQALLPNRKITFFEEPPYSLSKNCRNAGNIFQVVKCFHKQAPEVSMFLAEKGIIKLSIFNDQGEKEAIQSAIQEALKFFSPHEITVLTTEYPPLSKSILNGLVIHDRASGQWQKEVLQAAALTSRLTGNQVFIDEAANLHYSLSNSIFPNESDIQTVNYYFKKLVDSYFGYSRGSALRIIRWRLDKNRELVLDYPNPINAKLLANFYGSRWAETLPKAKTYHLVNHNNRYQSESDPDTINFCDVATFKGLESTAIILFIRSLRDNLSTNLYVGMSRAIFYLHFITDKHSSTQFSKSAWFRRFLDLQNKTQ